MLESTNLQDLKEKLDDTSAARLWHAREIFFNEGKMKGSKRKLIKAYRAMDVDGDKRREEFEQVFNALDIPVEFEDASFVTFFCSPEMQEILPDFAERVAKNAEAIKRGEGIDLSAVDRLMIVRACLDPDGDMENLAREIFYEEHIQAIRQHVHAQERPIRDVKPAEIEKVGATRFFEAEQCNSALIPDVTL